MILSLRDAIESFLCCSADTKEAINVLRDYMRKNGCGHCILEQVLQILRGSQVNCNLIEIQVEAALDIFLNLTPMNCKDFCRNLEKQMTHSVLKSWP